ncbi:MAG: pyridoxal-phosphate dependent enzyme, partial [Anaerolineae bacterium]|nr:pyridoxal-phosphate dependent enzyme [Anaerolineae bacterium]
FAPGYPDPSEAGLEALCLMARTEGILLDPVYTGKALAGLLDQVRQGRWGKGDTVIFLHTGGTPALFAYAGEVSPMARRENP